MSRTENTENTNKLPPGSECIYWKYVPGLVSHGGHREHGNTESKQSTERTNKLPRGLNAFTLRMCLDLYRTENTETSRTWSVLTNYHEGLNAFTLRMCLDLFPTEVTENTETRRAQRHGASWRIYALLSSWINFSNEALASPNNILDFLS